MNVRQYFQTLRAIMPLAAASALAACGIDLQSYGEPFFNLARDAGVSDAATNQPADTAGSSAEGSQAGRQAPVQNDAGGGAHARDAGALDAGDSEDAGANDEDSALGGAGGTAGGAAGAAGIAGNAGAAGHSAGTGGSTAAAVSFSDVYTGIIAAGCSCHNGGAGGLDLATRDIAYASLVSVPSTSCLGELRVVPGDAQASVLFHSLAHSSLGFCEVPSMPRNSPQLSAADLAALQAWIDAGARDD